MFSEGRSEEGNLTYLSKNVRKLDTISLYQVIISLQEKGYSISFSCKNEFEFSPTFVDDIEFNVAKKNANIILNFNNFFSYSPVLQDHLAAKVIHEKNKSFLSFLNLFYNRIFQILFENRKLNHPYFSMDIHVRIISSLSGLTDKKDMDYLQYNSFFTCKHRSKKNLEKLLYQFSGIVVRIQEYLGEFVNFGKEYQINLNGESRLNGYFSLGKKYWCEESKIKIVFYPKSFEDLNFFKDKNKSQSLLNLIDRFINNTVNYDVFIFPHKIIPSTLKKTNKTDYKLGLNTFLCINEKINESTFFKFYIG